MRVSPERGPRGRTQRTNCTRCATRTMHACWRRTLRRIASSRKPARGARTTVHEHCLGWGWRRLPGACPPSIPRRHGAPLRLGTQGRVLTLIVITSRHSISKLMNTETFSTPPHTLVIASRESRLAMWQAEHVRCALHKLYPSCDVKILGMTTRGDQILDRTLSKVGGKGLFVKELEAALADGRADLAVHSLKDEPMELPAGFALSTVHGARRSARRAGVQPVRLARRRCRPARWWARPACAAKRCCACVIR